MVTCEDVVTVDTFLPCPVPVGAVCLASWLQVTAAMCVAAALEGISKQHHHGDHGDVAVSMLRILLLTIRSTATRASARCALCGCAVEAIPAVPAASASATANAQGPLPVPSACKKGESRSVMCANVSLGTHVYGLLQTVR
jgi:hypothetical protein